MLAVRRVWMLLGAVTMVAAMSMFAGACGILPGTDSGGSSAANAGTVGPRPTPTSTPTPTPRPTPTGRPTATPLPTPTPTPNVEDSYTQHLAEMRGLFTSDDLAADIAELVPLPFDVPIPNDADLERVELLYRRWDLWEQIVGQFPPIDTAADVQVELAFLTDADVDPLRELFGEGPLANGYVIETDDSEAGVFSDVIYQLNGGILQRGRDGETRVTIFRQGDQTFVEVRVTAELTQDATPPLIAWPELFEVPFSGSFVDVSSVALETSEGIEVGSGAFWVIGVEGSSQEATLETMLAEYPVNNITIDRVVSTGEGDAAVASIEHPTGSSGTLTVDFFNGYTSIEVRLSSLPG